MIRPSQLSCPGSSVDGVASRNYLKSPWFELSYIYVHVSVFFLSRCVLMQLLAMIGGVIHSCHAVNGAVMSRRKKGDKVALWTSKKSTKINLDIW